MKDLGILSDAEYRWFNREHHLKVRGTRKQLMMRHFNWYRTFDSGHVFLKYEDITRRGLLNIAPRFSVKPEGSKRTLWNQIKEHRPQRPDKRFSSEQYLRMVENKTKHEVSWEEWHEQNKKLYKELEKLWKQEMKTQDKKMLRRLRLRQSAIRADLQLIHHAIERSQNDRRDEWQHFWSQLHENAS